MHLTRVQIKQQIYSYTIKLKDLPCCLKIKYNKICLQDPVKTGNVKYIINKLTFIPKKSYSVHQIGQSTKIFIIITVPTNII